MGEQVAHYAGCSRWLWSQTELSADIKQKLSLFSPEVVAPIISKKLFRILICLATEQFSREKLNEI